MKNNSKRKAGSSSVGSNGVIIEASNRKARRKEQRHSKKKKPQQQQPQQPQKSTGNKQKNSNNAGNERDDHPSKKVKFSNTVEEKTIPSRNNKTPLSASLANKSRNASSKSQSNSAVASNHNNLYDRLDEDSAAALRRDQMEIEYLESSLGIKGRKGKEKDGTKKLNAEYAKNEGFGDDFGDFLMGLDDLVERCVGADDDGEQDSNSGHSEASDDDSERSEERDCISAGGSDEENVDFNKDPLDDKKFSDDNSASDDFDDDEEHGSHDEDSDPYAHLDEDTAFALRNEDAEISQLEEKLGLTSSFKAKKKLKKELASTFQGYGEDFGDFLEELDMLGERIRTGKSSRGSGRGNSDDSADEDDFSDGEHDSEIDHTNNKRTHSDSESGEDSDDDDDLSDTVEEDHNVAHVYQPTTGEDIYGNKIDSTDNDTAKPTKYIPPHLRKKLNQETSKDAIGDSAANGADAAGTSNPAVITADPETIKLIQRSLNNSLNRLGDQTLESVSKSIASLYSQFPFHDMNDCLWNNVQLACIPPHMVMSGLIPLYVAAVSGVHFLGGDGIQLGGCLVEWSVKRLSDSLTKRRQDQEEAGDEEQFDVDYEKINKESSNLILIVCYLYNYNVVHCSLIYDLVRDFIENFTEADVESLLLILSHCGQQLRSDDPSALKEIVLLVTDRAQKAASTSSVDTSRIQYMVSTIIELRNNKPRKQDVVIREKTNWFKKCIGRLKSSALSGKRGTGSCLRITLRDVLDAESKGRWWLVGASWAGNQHHQQLFDEGNTAGKVHPELKKTSDRANSNSKTLSSKSLSSEEKLLALASAQRMNTDARRAIFCIVMGSMDCDDAFEKLIRAGMLKPKAERDVIRVIVHCCGEEKAFNPFYAFVAMRICEYQPKSKFTLMLTFWDVFKQLESFSARKVANLAKLLAHLIGTKDKKCLTIGALKRIEFSPSDMPEMTIIFLTIFMTNLLESSDSTDHIQNIFSHGATSTPQARTSKKYDSEDDEDGAQQQQTTKKEDLGDLRESVSMFLLQYLKSSPKNVKDSKFQKNLSAAIKACGQTNSSF